MPNDAEKFAKEVCLGNQEALQCCDLFYKYAHGWDDIIDSKEDGRPTMSNEQIIEHAMNCVLLFNCTFFVKHRDLLFSCVVSITNTWADSVLWERDPIEHRRVMANVLRTCGDDFFFMVAMIIGGWKHVRKLSPAIRERDFVYQNDPKHLAEEGR